MNSEKECNGDIEKSGCNGAFLEKRKDCELELTWRHALKQVSDKSFSFFFFVSGTMPKCCRFCHERAG